MPSDNQVNQPTPDPKAEEAAAKKAAEKKPIEEKQFSLKPIELRVIEGLQQTYFANVSNFFSFIALERLAYHVTDRTQFRIEDGKLFIGEAPKPEEPVSTTATPNPGETPNAAPQA